MRDTSTPLFGAWITLNSTIAVEQIAQLGFDFVIVDGQHGVLGYAEMRDALIAVTAAGGPMPIVRVSSNNAGEIGRMLDAGAQGIIIPMINTAEDARAASRAAHYATSGGQRSYSPVRYGPHFGATPGQTDEGVILLAMIETSTALAQIDEILDIPGIAGVFVGPYDLSLALGARVPLEDRVLPTLEEALVRVRTAATERGKIAGIYCGTGAEAVRRAEQGFTLVNAAHDMSAIRESMFGELSIIHQSGLRGDRELEPPGH